MTVHVDRAHHHPRVQRNGRRWEWECACGAHSTRKPKVRYTWKQTVVGALIHSGTQR